MLLRRFMSTSIPKRLTAAERATALATIDPSWKLVDGRDAITRNFEFRDFNEAWSFMSRTALIAEQGCHHPEWFNVYNRVDVTLSTHDCGGLSTNDISMAKKMDEFAAALHKP
ncbi:4a-hydroxytetrahydrobiopterin dehydratase [Saprolegnia diclina VS20]|uniref:4a-hydroxytetrahydrobiopterin dehydratase n=1 Tax=Saprolegnia diclina (strain VS20) TaxID=1156394 RepID=T0Q331_SAPDV|nr:4a-hydroxytetrahydrobiopterin dehydratase [Saprolegnia diclina VS20]EQC27815.1 4a-hydroxytetrahydrobiopterin dehydratase [Saprolegnia diclina VS20]|eukprot:XP_008618745.1 4a-hydroxytetrahydrobiopterin dehydratase [Saprolegnia diclina VS20]